MCGVVQLNQWRPRALICVICDVLMAFGPCVGPCVLQSGLPGLRFVDLSIFQARGSWWKTRPPFGSRGPSVRSNLPHREPRACQLGATVKPHSRTSKAPRELQHSQPPLPRPHAAGAHAPRPAWEMEASESSLGGPTRQSTRVSMPPNPQRLRRSVSVLAISAHQDEAAG